MAFDTLLRRCLPQNAAYQTRSEGPAFLNVACNLYDFARIDYVTFNVGVKAGQKRHMHAWHAVDGIAQCFTDGASKTDLHAELDWPRLLATDGVDLATWTAVPLAAEFAGQAYALRTLHGELALAAVTWKDDGDNAARRITATRDVRHLMNYFHRHLLRINGVDTSSELIMSARELDCLSWTAAGKTAWEASIILGISERTVRFHLNVAREKLNCATTTQAVAKAISQQLIQLSA